MIREIALLILLSSHLFTGFCDNLTVTTGTHSASKAEIEKFPTWLKLQESRYRGSALPTSPRAIAEFEPMSSVIISYQNFDKEEFGFNTSFVKLLAEKITVKIFVSSNLINSLRSELENIGTDINNIEFIPYTTDSYWTRDYGAWWIADGGDNISIVDFTYNRPRDMDNGINSKLATDLGVNIYSMPLVQCGGNYMCNGSGEATSTDLITDENPQKSKSEIKTIMKNYLGIEDYLIRPDPLGEYIKHVDCWGKYLALDKIIISSVTGSKKTDFDKAAEFFKNRISPLGTPYKVYRAFTDGEPYTNSLILNSRVFVPIQGTDNDSAALAVYKEAMPGYEVIGVRNSTKNPWLSTDALHCRTRGIPDFSMVSIAHTPKTDTIAVDSLFSIEAVINDYSSSGLNSDSLICYYRYDNNKQFSPIKLSTTNDSLYRAEIPTPFRGVKSIQYYIFAKNLSNRSAKFPIMGEQDPIKRILRKSIVSISNKKNYLSNNNPRLTITNHSFQVTSKKDGELLSIYRPNGVLLIQKKLLIGMNIFSNFKSGIYIYRISNSNFNKSGRVVIQ